jgi:hypothetical protein
MVAPRRFQVNCPASSPSPARRAFPARIDAVDPRVDDSLDGGMFSIYLYFVEFK